MQPKRARSPIADASRVTWRGDLRRRLSVRSEKIAAGLAEDLVMVLHQVLPRQREGTCGVPPKG